MSALAGTGRLARLALRRDRVLLPVWLLAISTLTAGVVASIIGLYRTEQERLAAASFSAASPIARVFDGPASGTDLGAMAFVESYLVLAVLVALMSGQAVVRHTRLEEETGRAELVGSAVVGRRAPLAAGVAVALAANLVVAALVAGAILLVDGDLAVTGALASGLALAGVGVVFTGVAAVAVQVLSSARAANLATGAVLGLAFLLRAAGDALGEVGPSGVEVVSAWPSWLSPLGWGHQVRPFHQDNWEVLGLFAAASALLVAGAWWLTGRRDIGAGLVPPRPGPPRAGRRLGSSLGLAWRLQRGVLLAWAVGLAVVGAAFGAVGESAEEVIGLSEEFEQALLALAPEGGIVELYFAFAVGFLGIAAAGYTVQALLRPRTEEADGRLEPLLATPTSRLRWLGGHIAIAAVGTVALLVVLGASGALAFGALTGDWSAAGGMLTASVVQLPAVLVVGAVVVAAVTLVPRWASAIAWGTLAASLVMGQLGALFELPQPVLNVSPFTHVPAVPAQPFEALPVVVLCAVAVALTTAGAAAFRRRDLAVGA